MPSYNARPHALIFESLARTSIQIPNIPVSGFWVDFSKDVEHVHFTNTFPFSFVMR